MVIGNKVIGDGHPCYIIAEIGINHNGDLEIAKNLIGAAHDAGCDAVKFQKRTVDVVYTKEELRKPRENPFGKFNGDLKHGLEFGKKEYEEIDYYCQEMGMDWFASCWDEASVDFIQEFYPQVYKIASASITDKELLKRHIKTKMPMIISTGMSTEKEINKAYEVFRNKNDCAIMHCTSTYPCKLEELNLVVIKRLKMDYGFPVGYSGHEVGISTTVCAVAMGANLIERHITLDRSMWGSDQAASVEPHGFAQMVRDIRAFEKAKGDGKKVVYDSELPIIKKLRRK